jgi:hypothetical protein
MEGLFRVGLLVQDYGWLGRLVVLQYVAENWRELIVECRGYDVHGNQILRFLVVDKSLAVRDPEVFMTIGSLSIIHKLPAALSSIYYLPQGHCDIDLPLPYPPII